MFEKFEFTINDKINDDYAQFLFPIIKLILYDERKPSPHIIIETQGQDAGELINQALWACIRGKSRDGGSFPKYESTLLVEDVIKIKGDTVLDLIVALKVLRNTNGGWISKRDYKKIKQKLLDIFQNRNSLSEKSELSFKL